MTLVTLDARSKPTESTTCEKRAAVSSFRLCRVPSQAAAKMPADRVLGRNRTGTSLGARLVAPCLETNEKTPASIASEGSKLTTGPAIPSAPYIALAGRIGGAAGQGTPHDHYRQPQTVSTRKVLSLCHSSPRSAVLEVGPRVPNMNGFVERWVQVIKAECPDKRWLARRT